MPVFSTITTNAPTSIGDTGCNVSSRLQCTLGEGTWDRVGICYYAGTSGDPVYTDNGQYYAGDVYLEAPQYYDYAGSLAGLTKATAYRIRAFARYKSTGSYGYGTTLDFNTTGALDPPTNVAATENQSGKVVVTWTKVSGATNYAVYRDGSPLSGTIGDVATYDDTTAAAPIITPGSAVASDGTYVDRVALDVSGNSVANGTQYTYTVYAYKALGGWSAVSSGDTGYRLAGSMTYQWQRSAGASDADYSNLTGATTEAYSDTTAPDDGSHRYYKCLVDASGSAQTTTAVNDGYRDTGSAVLSLPVMTSIALRGAECSSEITEDGGPDITARGVCWNTTGTPVTTDSKTTDGTGIGSYLSILTGLTYPVDYHLRSYATNNDGTYYSDEIIFRTDKMARSFAAVY